MFSSPLWSDDPPDDSLPEDEVPTPESAWMDDSGLEIDEIEAAYRKAQEAIDSVESELGFSEPPDSPGEQFTGLEKAGQAGAPSEGITAASSDPAIGGPVTGSGGGFEIGEFQTNAAPPSHAPAASPAVVATTADHGERYRRVTPAQIVEAALFVGGKPLTVRQFCTVLGGDFEREYVEGLIASLNTRYAAERRPYEINLAEGGYRLELRSEFESVSSRVFGLGPKDVKLTQDVLEVLALIAYQQPIGREQIEAAKAGASGTVRQLLRRELIAIDRSEGSRGEVSYRTTKRFLELFGLRDLDELPQADELAFR